MYYLKLELHTQNQELRELCIAEMSEMGYEGFEETADELCAFIPESDYDADAIQDMSNRYSVSFAIKRIEPQNWNAEWEKNFEPVIVPGFCTVRADFHNIFIDTLYEIIVTPKMSFGTGHHATTQLMMMQMQHLDCGGKKVMDFGTGTGILAILAKKLGASAVDAIDNDEWSYENAKENVERNNCLEIIVQQGSIELVKNSRYDIVLANINRHILLQYMSDMYGLLPAGGILLMSGLLPEDADIIHASADKASFEFEARQDLNNWICLRYRK